MAVAKEEEEEEDTTTILRVITGVSADRIIRISSIMRMTIMQQHHHHQHRYHLPHHKIHQERTRSIHPCAILLNHFSASTNITKLLQRTKQTLPGQRKRRVPQYPIRNIIPPKLTPRNNRSTINTENAIVCPTFTAFSINIWMIPGSVTCTVRTISIIPFNNPGIKLSTYRRRSNACREYCSTRRPY